MAPTGYHFQERETEEEEDEERGRGKKMAGLKKKTAEIAMGKRRRGNEGGKKGWSAPLKCGFGGEHNV